METLSDIFKLFNDYTQSIHPADIDRAVEIILAVEHTLPTFSRTQSPRGLRMLLAFYRGCCLDNDLESFRIRLEIAGLLERFLNAIS